MTFFCRSLPMSYVSGDYLLIIFIVFSPILTIYNPSLKYLLAMPLSDVRSNTGDCINPY